MEVRSLYERVGGETFFTRLVDDFYDGVDDDATLRPMYPSDLTDSRRHLAMFLVQYWGGPPTYQEQRGHPRLRLRHAPHRIDEVARDAWLSHMLAALAQAVISDADRGELSAYFEMAANQLRNT